MGSSKTMKNIDRFGIWATYLGCLMMFWRVSSLSSFTYEKIEIVLLGENPDLKYWYHDSIHGDMIWIDMADHKASMPPKKRRDCNNQRQVGKRHSKTFVGRLMWLQIAGCLMVSSCLVILFHRGSWILTHSRWWEKNQKTRKGSSTHKITTFMGAINHP